MGQTDPTPVDPTKDPADLKRQPSKSHDPEADRENAWEGRDRFEPTKPGEAPSSGPAVPPAHS